MNAECGMMNDEYQAALIFSFIIPHSAFIIPSTPSLTVGLPPCGPKCSANGALVEIGRPRSGRESSSARAARTSKNAEAAEAGLHRSEARRGEGVRARSREWCVSPPGLRRTL